MNEPGTCRLVRGMRQFSKASSILTILVGLLVLIGWFGNVTFLKSIRPNLPDVKMATALGFIFAGVCLLFLHRGRMMSDAGGRESQHSVQTVAPSLAAIVLLIGLLSFLEAVFGLQDWVEQLLEHAATIPVAGASPEGMMPTSALSLFLLGLSLLFLQRASDLRLRVSQFLATAVSLVGLLEVIGNVYGVKSTWPFGAGSTLAPAEAVTLMIVGLGVLHARPERGFMETVSGPGYVGELVRVLAPIGVAVPFLLGWIRLAAARAGFRDPQIELSLFVSSNIVIFFSLIWLASRGLLEAERNLLASERRYRSLFENSLDAILLTAPDGRIFSANPAACQLYGRTEEEICGMGRTGLVDPEDPRLASLLEERVRTGSARGELLQIRSDGTRFPTEVSSVVFETAEGERTSMLVRDISERKQMEEALRHSHQLLEKTFAGLHDAVFVLDSHTARIIDCNPASSEMFGYSRQEMLGQTTNFLHVSETKLEEFRRELFRAVEVEGFLLLPEFRMKRKDGSIFPTEHSVMPIQDDQGKRIGWVSVVRDTTDRKRAEEALRQAETHLRTVLNNAPITIFAIDNQGRFTLSEGKGLDRVGLKPGENVGGAALDLYGGIAFVEYNGRVTTGKDVIERVFSGRSVNAINELHGVYFDNHIGPIRDAEGKVVGIVGVATDITDRKQAEDALRESEERYRSLVEAAPDVVYTISAEDGLLTSLNAAFETITGWSRAEWLGRHFTGIVHPDDRTAAVETFQMILRGETSAPYQLRILSKSGEYLVGEFTSTPQIKGGKVVGELGIARNITERKREEEALALLAHAMRSIGECVSVTDTEDNILFVNDAFLKTYGYTRDELIGKPISIVRPRTTEPATDEVLSATLQGGWRGELVNRKKDGTEFPITLSTSVVRKEKGQLLGLVGIAADISERKREEEERIRSEKLLRESRDRLELALAGADLGMWDWTIPTNRNIYDTRWARMLGYSLDELEPNYFTWEELVHPEDRARVVGALKAHVEGKTPTYETEHRLRTKSGEWKWILDRGKVLEWDDQGKPVRAAGTHMDITERKRAEEALRLSEKKYRNLVDNALAGVYQSTVGGDILFANDAFVRMLEYSSFEELASVKAPRLYRDARDRERFISLLKEKRKVSAFESELLTKNGAVKMILTSATLDGDLISGMIRDITEQKKAEIALRAARSRLQRLSRRLLEIQENERRSLARELHDEIGQILTAAKIDLQVIRRGPLSDDLAARLDDNIEMLDRCLHQVRNLSLDLRPSMLDDLGLVAALRWQLERQAQRVGFQARLIAEDLPERFDPDLETTCFRIAQEALTNISRHAEASNVEIELKICKPELLLTIRDDGVGFDVDRALADGTHGKSFGILGMQERVALLDGKLEINSEEKRGTIVTVRLPLRLVASR
jgi:PAS domain S-box-containing protein